MSVFIGMDCGGSSSRVLAIDDTGAILFQGQSGAANLVSTPDARLRRNLAHAVENCPAATHVCGCFAGLVSEEIRSRANGILAELFPGAAVRSEPDYAAAFYASPPGTDICVIAGTGSLVCSRGQNGIVKSGGRGYILGDAGSGIHYGRDALVRFLDEPGSASGPLRSEVERLFGTLEEARIVPLVYRSGTPATLLAKLVKAVGSDARSGEAYAIESIERNTSQLVSVIVSHIQRHMPERSTLNLSLAGGVWKAAPVFRDVLERQLKERLPSRNIAASRVQKPPLYGAVELAREMSIEH